ncbi:MAG: hypothetical protein ACI8PZ_004753 [Myxococcota bacterium]|jgi:hypothetical protein
MEDDAELGFGGHSNATTCLGQSLSARVLDARRPLLTQRVSLEGSWIWSIVP